MPRLSLNRGARLCPDRVGSGYWLSSERMIAPPWW